MAEEKTIILTSGKCSWGKCFCCGWGRQDGPEVNIHDLKNRIDEKFRNLDVKKLKIFASGSFFDDKQFPRVIRQYIAQKCKERGITDLTVESRPEFINKDVLKDFSGLNLTVAIGLEVADDEILKKYNKGFMTSDFIKAADILHSAGCKVRTYLMVGLPFIEKENAKEMLRKSVEFARKYSDSIILINTFPHSAAPIFDLWCEGKWKPLDEKEFKELTEEFEDCEKEFDNFLFIPKFHKDKRVKIVGAGKEQLIHPYYEIWQDYIQRFYTVPEGKDILLFIPCAFRKPYFKSKLHKAIMRTIKSIKNYEKLLKRLHFVVISSPGVIPYEFVNMYPFNAYDWPEWEETKEIKDLYIKVTKERVLKYLKAHKEHYKTFLCYFKYDSESFVAIQDAAKELGIEIKNCLKKETYEKIKSEKNPLSLEPALADLKAALESLT